MTSESLQAATPQPLATTSDERIAATIQMAIERNISPESLEKLVDLQYKMMMQAAEREFAEALADFQANCPAIVRSKLVSIPSRSGAPISYMQFTLDDIMDAVTGPLAARGMSIGFSAAVAGAVMTIRCTVRHKNGAKPIESEFPITTSNPNPGMSEQHKWVGAQTFAKRYALINVLGLPLTDPDPAGDADPTTITEEQAATLQVLIDEVAANVEKFKQAFGIKALAEMRQNQYAEAVRLLERKRKGGAR